VTRQRRHVQYKPPSVIADWQALYRHSKSPHSSLLRMLSGQLFFSLFLSTHDDELFTRSRDAAAAGSAPRALMEKPM